MQFSDLLGIPYRERGRTTEGVDCWGLVCLFHRKLGVDIPDYLATYKSSSDMEGVGEAITEQKQNWLKVDEPEFGDVLVFNICGFPCHVGVYIGSGDFMHSFNGTDVCIERLGSLSWSRRLLETYRWQP